MKRESDDRAARRGVARWTNPNLNLWCDRDGDFAVEKILKNIVEMFLGNAEAGVAHFDADAVFGAPATQQHAAFARLAAGVGD